MGFHFPNIWENHIGESLRIIIAFVPVDEENTLLYGPYYQKMVRFPVVWHLVNCLRAKVDIIFTPILRISTIMEMWL